MYNAVIALLVLAPVVIVIYGAFFRKIEIVNEQQESDSSVIEDLTHGIDEEMYN